ncbi:MAG: protease inhibitor I42 family protein [Fluviibacter sp.]
MSGFEGMGKTKYGLMVLLSAISLAGCAPSLFPVEMPVTASLTDSGGTASLIPYQPLVVRLPANPSTGYVWSYAVAGDDVLRLETVSGESAGANGMVGAPGEQVWSFRAQGSGLAVLTYFYARPWEKNTPPAKIFTLKVQVAPAQ